MAKIFSSSRFSSLLTPKKNVSSSPILSFQGGFSNPRLSFQGHGLSKENYATIASKVGGNTSDNSVNGTIKFNLDAIKSVNYKSNLTLVQELLAENPTEMNIAVDQSNVQKANSSSRPSDDPKFEIPYMPSVQELMNLNNYRFTYKNEIFITADKFQDENKNVKLMGYNIEVAPALFNPLYMVQAVGMTANTPLLNTTKAYNGIDYDDVSDCTIKELVKLSYKKNSILGNARYRYTDFMYCKDLGKLANNHLITLRRFPYPIGDNIFDSSLTDANGDTAESGDIGRLVTWFGTDDNKLEDIIKFDYRATWREMNSEIQEVESKEDDKERGPVGMLLNTINPAYNKAMAAGTAGDHHAIMKIGGGRLNLTAKYGDALEMQRMYDKHKVYEPKNTIQSTHQYEGKLEFVHEFTLNFCYKLRAYDNINPKSAFLDLIGNILAVTYRKGTFWGGSRRWIGPPQNTTGWQKANAFINNSYSSVSSAFKQLMNGGAEMGSILGKLSNFIPKNISIESVKESATKCLETWSNFAKDAKLDQALLGVIKGKLGRPALYALNSLLTGDNVGLWHVTIGNPKNPIISMGNLIMTNASFQESGPLGLDDFPTEIKVSVTLKHARGRDSVEIGRMFTRGENALYYSLKNNNINKWFGEYNNAHENISSEEFKLLEDRIPSDHNDKSKENTNYKKDSVRRLKDSDIMNAIEDRTNDSVAINDPWAARYDHFNQTLNYDLAMILDEIA